MSSERFFIITGSPSVGDLVQLGEGESRHLFKVVRARPGDEVNLLDGAGGVYRAVVRTGGMVGGLKKGAGVTAEIVSIDRPDPGPPADMAIPLIKSHRMEFAVEKCAELGVRRIIPFRCERSIWKGGEREGGRKVERLERKVAAACKQSGNPWFPVVEPVVELAELAGTLAEYEQVFLADPGGRPFSTVFCSEKASGPVIGIVGPEGGFTDSESETLLTSGAVTVSFGLNRLRTETSVFLLASGMLLR
jgi:16S rRNA (uracil1498-N3)-methyltransferase